MKPFGTSHFLNGFTITDNVFKSLNGPNLERVEVADTTHAVLVHGKARNVTVTGNMYNNIDNRMQNPVTVSASISAPTTSWEVDVSEFIPFGGKTRTVIAAIPDGQISDGASQPVFEQPYATVGQGVGEAAINLTWSKPVSGKMKVTVRCDNPT